MNWENIEGIVVAVATCLAFCVGVKGCSEANQTSDNAMASARIEAVKSGRSANAIACIINSDNMACERAEREGNDDGK